MCDYHKSTRLCNVTIIQCLSEETVAIVYNKSQNSASPRYDDLVKHATKPYRHAVYGINSICCHSKVEPYCGYHSFAIKYRCHQLVHNS